MNNGPDVYISMRVMHSESGVLSRLKEFIQGCCVTMNGFVKDELMALVTDWLPDRS
jgi:hypothetical protein